MTQDIGVLAVSIIYYALEYFFLQLHASDTAPLFILALCIDFLFFVYVLMRFFENKISSVTIGTTVLPFFWIIKTAVLKIPAFQPFSTIPDWTILLIVSVPYLYYLINMSGGLTRGKKNKTDRTKINTEHDDLGDYPIWITPDLVLPTHDRFTHTQVIGSTGSGKTRYVFYPWIYQDIRNGAGVFILDIKSNMKDKIIKFVTDNKANRDMDFMCFSLGEKGGQTWNPLAGDNAGEIANRAFSALYFEKGGEPYYIESQKGFLFSAIAVLHKKWGALTLEDLYKATLNPALYFKQMCSVMPDDVNAKYLLEKLKDPELNKILSGLVNKLAKFVNSDWAPQINARKPDIDVAELVTKNKILLFQANSGVYSQDYKPLSILMMMHLQAEISKRYSAKQENPFFIYLDEFYNILYPDFPELINKAREAKVGLIFGHQALGDLELYGQNVKNIVLTNSRNKVILNIEDPVTAEYYSKAWGTDTIEKRQSAYSTEGGEKEKGFSIKEEEVFIAHPNEFKYLKLGEGYIKLETAKGKIIKKVNFKDVNYDAIKTHKLHIPHRVKQTAEDPHAVFVVEEKPQQSIKDKFSKKKPAEQVSKEMLEALKKDIPEEE